MVPGAIEWPLGSYFQILHLKQLSEDCTGYVRHGRYVTARTWLVTGYGYGTVRVSDTYIWVSR